MKKLLLLRTTTMLLFSLFSAITVSATCTTPTGLTSTKINASGVDLIWTAIPGALSYELQIKDASSWFASWTTIPVPTNKKTIIALAVNHPYKVKVRTKCTNTSWSNFSAEYSFTTALCSAPSGLNASNITSSSAMLNWTAVSGATSYQIQYKNSSSAIWSTVTSATNSKIINSLTSNSNYSFKVKTVFSAATFSNYSSPATFTTAGNNSSGSCNMPSGLNTINMTSVSATLTWTAVSGATSYVIKYKKSSGTTWTTVTSTSNSKAISSLSASTYYAFKVKTVCSSTASSSYSSTFAFNTASTSSGTGTNSVTCNKPKQLSASSVTSSGANLHWGAVNGAASYVVKYRKNTSAASWTTVTSMNNSITISGLSQNTSYVFMVKTICSATASSHFTSSIAFTTPATGVGSCDTPTGLTATNITYSSATLNWTAVSGAISYEIEYLPLAGWSQQITVSSTTNSKAISGLSPNKAYRFRVKAKCSSISSSNYSLYADFQTLTKLSGWKTSEEDEHEQTTFIATQEEIKNPIIEKSISNISIYPNPAQRFVNIHFEGTIQKAGIKVFDIIGKQVFSENIPIPNGEYTLPVENFPSGIYQVAIQSESETIVKKLIVQK